VTLFGTLHCSILLAIAIVAAAFAGLGRRGIFPVRPMTWTLGAALALNEVVWWFYRYSREGVHVANLPLQLCDAAVWLSILACLTGASLIVEFAYFAGLAGAGMALLTPNLLSPWPTYPAIYFFLAHGGIVVCMAALVYGSDRKFSRVSVWRAFALLLAYAALVGPVDRLSGANFMFLLRKPDAASPLDQMGAWPWYLVVGAAAALALFWLLWLPVRPRELLPAAAERPIELHH
jgi:hypothetical integral membrane protein (TIGR02206 family)